jgi:hypothetical protein
MCICTDASIVLSAIPTRPTPNLSVHSSMKIVGEILREDIASSPPCPSFTFRDVIELSFIEFVPKSYISELKFETVIRL